MKVRNYDSSILNELLSECTLENELQILNEFAFINLLSILGFREDKMWTKDEEELYAKLYNASQQHTQDILNLINKL